MDPNQIFDLLVVVTMLSPFFVFGVVAGFMVLWKPIKHIGELCHDNHHSPKLDSVLSAVTPSGKMHCKLCGATIATKSRYSNGWNRTAEGRANCEVEI